MRKCGCCSLRLFLLHRSRFRSTNKRKRNLGINCGSSLPLASLEEVKRQAVAQSRGELAAGHFVCTRLPSLGPPNWCPGLWVPVDQQRLTGFVYVHVRIRQPCLHGRAPLDLFALGRGRLPGYCCSLLVMLPHIVCCMRLTKARKGQCC
jgi:hypothetical protein